jgi:hypothetical protein
MAAASRLKIFIIFLGVPAGRTKARRGGVKAKNGGKSISEKENSVFGLTLCSAIQEDYVQVINAWVSALTPPGLKLPF